MSFSAVKEEARKLYFKAVNVIAKLFDITYTPPVLGFPKPEEIDDMHKFFLEHRALASLFLDAKTKKWIITFDMKYFIEVYEKEPAIYFRMKLFHALAHELLHRLRPTWSNRRVEWFAQTLTITHAMQWLPKD